MLKPAIALVLLLGDGGIGGGVSETNVPRPSVSVQRSTLVVTAQMPRKRRTVEIQRRDGRHWTTVASSKVPKSGKLRHTLRRPTGTTVTLRLRLPGAQGLAGPARTVTLRK